MCRRMFPAALFVWALPLILTTTVEAADPSLVALWKLDEGSGTIAKDSSRNGHDGTLNGDPQWVAGQLGGALDFDGAGDFVEVPHSPGLSITKEITIAAWTKMSANASGEMAIVSKGGWSANDLPYELTETPGGVIFWQFYDDAGRDSCAPPSPPANEWHHIGATYDGTIFKCYIDGQLAQEWAYAGTMPENTASVTIGRRSRGGTFFNGVIDEVAIFNRALTAQEISKIMAGLSEVGLASEPIPEDEATDVSRDMVLSWTSGEFAPATNGHIIYLSESFSDVNDGVGGTPQSATSYDPGRLEFGTTYYWRVDEVNAPPDSTVFRGEVWSFTTEPVGYPIDGANITATASSSGQANLGPDNTINGSGLNANDLHSTEATDMWLSSNEPLGAWIQYEFDKVHKLHEMWVWNSNQVFESLFGFGMKDVAVEYSTDGAAWMALADVPQFTKAPGTGGYAHDTTVNFGGAAAKFVKLTATSNWGGVLPQFGLSEVRFFSIPVSAREPSPAAGATGVNPAGFLTWRAGREAATHDVYVSTDQQAVADGTAPAVSVTNASYNADLNLVNTYYWRIDEINDVETPTTWQGEIWSFSTSDAVVVDDFEPYNDIDPPDPESNRIFESWSDGFQVPTNGALIGYDPPQPSYLETTIVHGGSQSLPIFYSNTGGAVSSETIRTFIPGQDWTKHGITTLAMWFRGTVGNTGQIYVKINNSKIPYDGQAGNIALPGWQVWNIDLATSGASLQSVNSLSLGIDGNGAAGTLYFDDIALYAVPPVPVVEVTIADDNDDVEERIGPNNGAIDSTSSDLEMPYEDAGQGDPQIIGLRFTGIAVPQGSTITDAWVQFVVDETKGGTQPVNLIIEGELSGSAAAFSSTAGNVSSRPKTTAKIQWSVPNWTAVGAAGPDQRTPNLTSIIQEIVNQAGWTGEALVLIIRDDPANPSTGIRCAGIGSSVLLHIDYQ